MNVYEALLGIVQVPSYIPGGAWSFSKFISLLLWIVGFPIARKDKRGVDLISDALHPCRSALVTEAFAT
jgi:hypothetical protein